MEVRNDCARRHRSWGARHDVIGTKSMVGFEKRGKNMLMMGIGER